MIIFLMLFMILIRGDVISFVLNDTLFSWIWL